MILSDNTLNQGSYTSITQRSAVHLKFTALRILNQPGYWCWLCTRLSHWHQHVLYRNWDEPCKCFVSDLFLWGGEILFVFQNVNRHCSISLTVADIISKLIVYNYRPWTYQIFFYPPQCLTYQKYSTVELPWDKCTILNRGAIGLTRGLLFKIILLIQSCMSVVSILVLIALALTIEIKCPDGMILYPTAQEANRNVL